MKVRLKHLTGPRRGEVIELDDAQSYELELGGEPLLRVEVVPDPRRPRQGLLRIVAAGMLAVALGAGIVGALYWVTSPLRTTRHESARSEERAVYEVRVRELRADLRDIEMRMTPRDELEEHLGEVRRTLAIVEGSIDDRVTEEVERSLDDNPDLAAARAAVDRIGNEDANAEGLIARFSGSVCLVQAAYAFGRKRDGKWLFLRDLGEGGDEDADRIPLSLDGEGDVFRVEYTGTGFLADSSGIVLTNRHIAQPWWKSKAAAPLLEEGFEPRFLYLRAYFPGRAQAINFDPTLHVVDEQSDLAALFFRPTADLPPAIPISPSGTPSIGKRVLLLGYPSGLDAILARSDDEFARTVEASGGFDPLALLDELAERGMVRPLPSHGHLSDVLPDKLLFDAPTEVGGSGGPLLDLEGRVIAVNYGILKAFDRANFGVPVKRIRDLLERARALR